MNLKDRLQSIKFGIQLPPWYEEKLRIWAKWKGTTRANLAANIIQARIEANWPDIEAELSAAAVANDVSKEDFIKELLNGDED